MSGGVFDYSVSGTVRDSADPANTIDVKSELGWQDSSEGMGYLYIRHPIPVLPNIRLGTTSLQLGGTGTLTQDYVYNGVTYTASETVNSSIDLSHTEIALYYNLLDTFMSVDLGLNFKIFDGKFEITGSTSGSTSTAFNQTVPMLYASVAVPIPGTGFKVAGDISTTSYNHSTMTDYLLRLRYDTDFFLGVEAGYRSLHIDYQDSGSNEYATLDLTGPYLMATLTF